MPRQNVRTTQSVETLWNFDLTLTEIYYYNFLLWTLYPHKLTFGQTAAKMVRRSTVILSSGTHAPKTLKLRNWCMEAWFSQIQ